MFPLFKFQLINLTPLDTINSCLVCRKRRSYIKLNTFPIVLFCYNQGWTRSDPFQNKSLLLDLSFLVPFFQLIRSRPVPFRSWCSQSKIGPSRSVPFLVFFFKEQFHPRSVLSQDRVHPLLLALCRFKKILNFHNQYFNNTKKIKINKLYKTISFNLTPPFLT